MDEKNGIDLPKDGNPSDQEANEESVPQGEQKSEPTPEEKEMMESMGMGEDAQPDAEADAGVEAEEGADAQAGAESEEGPSDESVNADEGENPGQDFDSNLLSQDDIDNVLGAAGQDILDEVGGGSPEVNQADFQQLSVPSEKQEPRNIDLLMDVDLPVSIELGRTRMRISDILALGPGSIVELDKLVGEPVDLLVNKKCVARGEVVVVEESFGLRITQLVSPEERLMNLA